MGTWCGDSKRETPRFYKILDETGFNQNNFELITVIEIKKLQIIFKKVLIL